MDIRQHFKILGSGVYFPEKELSAGDIDRRIGKPPGWTNSNIGVRRRFECTPPESIATMAHEAVTRAMDDAGVNWSDIDLILDGSTSRHRPIPCNAVHTQALFGSRAQSIPCFDVQSTCLGFVVALNVANGLMQSCGYRHVLIVCSEAPLAAVNWQTPESAAIFGDGAAAFIVKYETKDRQAYYAHESYSDAIEACTLKGGGHLLPSYAYRPKDKADFQFQMDGQAVMRAAKKYLPAMVRKILHRAEIDARQLHVVPHQGAPKSMGIIQRALKIPDDRFHDYVADYGNLVAASIPVVLHLCMKDGSIPEHSRVMLLGTSAGYSQAAMIFEV